MLMLWTFHAHAQTGTVVGVVTDGASKTPMVGATVHIKGTTNGTTVDINGNYSINAAAKDSLVFSFIGYDTQTIAVKDNKIINATLTESPTMLEDVVVVGYGTLQKRDVTGAISSVTAEDIALKAPVDVFDALQGMAAGLQITSVSGEPGAEADVRIRGTSTFDSGTLPLYVVDGMPMDDISSINPLDIESIDLLKDAASASIYGSRAANGVILITTKKGVAGKPKINLKYQGSVSWVSHLIPFTTPNEARMYDRERNRLVDEYPDRYSFTKIVLTDSLKQFFNSSGNLADEIFRPAYKHQIDLNLSGVSDKINYYMSAGFMNEEGVVENSGNKRLRTRVNLVYNVSNRLTITNRTNFSVQKRNGITEGTVVSSIYDWLPYWSTFDVNGDPMHVIGGKRNPYTVAKEQTRLTDDYKAETLTSGVFRFNKYLKFTPNLPAAFSLRRYFNYMPEILRTSSGRTTGQDQSVLRYNYMTENFFNYDRKFKGGHDTKFVLGMSAQNWHDEYVNMRGFDYSTDLIYTLNAASELDLANTFTRIEEHSLASFFFRGTYSYKGKYVFATTMRYDGSSRFGPDNRWGLFPSVSGAWNFSEEKFMNWSKPSLDRAKLRISYAVTGNESIGNYDAWQRYFAGDPTTSGTNVSNHQNGAYGGGSIVTGVAPIQLAYNDLGWEQTSSGNIGLDLNFLKNKLRITIDGYEKKTTDLLYNADVPKETGYTTMRMNVGAMNNRGIEFTVDYNVIRNKTWNWNVSFNISHNNTVIKKLADGTPFYTGQNSAIYVYEGARLGEFWGYRHKGVFAYDESNAFDADWNQLTPVFDNGSFSGYELNGQPYTGAVNQKRNTAGEAYLAGDIHWLDSPANDENERGTINENDKVKLGCAQPDFFGGFNTSLRYKDFSFYVNLYFSIGGDVYNHTRFQRNSFTTTVRAPESSVLANMWLRPGDESIYPVPISRATYNGIGPSDYWMEDGSYVKLRTVRVSYNLPQNLIKKVSMSNAQMYVYGNNLLTWSKYKGFDPEFGGERPLAFGIDTGRYPRKLEVGVGINIGF